MIHAAAKPVEAQRKEVSNDVANRFLKAHARSIVRSHIYLRFRNSRCANNAKQSSDRGPICTAAITYQSACVETCVQGVSIIFIISVAPEDYESNLFNARFTEFVNLMDIEFLKYYLVTILFYKIMRLCVSIYANKRVAF